MKRLAWLLPVFGAIGAWRLFGFYAGWVGPIHLAASIALGLLLVATAIAPRPAIAVVLLAIEGAMIGLSLFGVHPIGFDLFPDGRLAIVVGAMVVLAIYGLVRRRVWGRWLALALGAVGAVSGGLNAINYWNISAHVEYEAWTQQTFEAAWVLWVSALGGAAIVANLAGARAQFTGDATWASRDRLVGSVRAAIISAFAAGPMLLVYGWLQPIAPATRVSALALAATLAIGTLLAVRGKVAGALVLVVAGLGLVAQTAATFELAADRHIAAYYAVFWLPAAALAVVCGARLLRAVIK